MAQISFLLVAFFLPLALGSRPKTINLEEIVEEINSDPHSTWKANTYGYNTIDVDNFVKTKLGAKLPLNYDKIDLKSEKNPFFTGPLQMNVPKLVGGLFFPKEYDARKQFSNCRSIGLIRDQSNCGSCWAVSAASVLSDRICIQSHGKLNFSLSGHYTASCDKSNHGCNGGYLDKVWKFYEQTGCITGGEYESDEGCQPYSIKPCGRYPTKYPCSSPLSLTPKCLKTRCTNEWYEHQYEKNIFKVKDYYQVGFTYITILNEFLMQHEIITNGPVQVGFLVFGDFLGYKSGIYNHKGFSLDDSLGGHAVKIIGWGEEKGVKYWIASNSWTEEWGENGTFRIVRGQNNCFIESMVYAGIPDL